MISGARLCRLLLKGRKNRPGDHEPKTAHLNLSRFKGVKTAEKTTLSGKADDENNYEQQPIVPVKEVIKMKKRMDVELAPYSFTMLTIQL
jgi:alpha-L-arabinofuranosidase